MRQIRTFVLLCGLVLVFVLSLVMAASASNGEASDLGAERKSKVVMKRVLLQNLEHLKALGGGVKPFEDRLNAIEQSEADEKPVDTTRDIEALSQSVARQLASVSDLRAKRPHPTTGSGRQRRLSSASTASIASTGSTASIASSYPSNNNAESAISRLLGTAGAGNSPVNSAGLDGDAREYLIVMARKIASQELGGLGVPCQGPLMLERFRNLHRISELRRQGREISNLLAYHNVTESIAGNSVQQPGLAAELGQRVGYLEQQLGLQPLSGTVYISHYKR